MASPPFVVDAETDCWVWQGSVNLHGYGKLTRGGRQWQAHRWFYDQLVPGGVPDGDLHHRCKNIRCVNPDHLEPMTRAGHSHAPEDGRHVLSWEQVHEIRSLRGTMTNRVIAKRFGVNQPQISKILANKQWHDPEYQP